MSLFGKKKKYRYNFPVFNYAQGYKSQGLEAALSPLVDFGDYGKYAGFNRKGNSLELLFDKEHRDLLDTDYSLFDPYAQKWNSFEDQALASEYLRSNATGQFAKDVSGMSDQELLDYVNQQDWMQEKEEYSDPYTKQSKLYYTPYEVALGYETGRTPDMRAKGKKKNQRNWASIHPNVGYDFWDNATLSDISNLSGINDFDLLSDASVLWQDPNVTNWTSGFLSEVDPWVTGGIDADYKTKKGSYRTGGIAGILGSVLSFIPGLQPLGIALSAINAGINKNPLGVAMSFLPALGNLGSMANGFTGQQAAMLAAQEAGLSTLGWAGATTGLQGLANAAGIGSSLTGLAGVSPYATNSVLGGIRSSLTGGDFATGALGGAISTGVNEYISPVIKNTLSEVGFSDDIASGFSNYLSSLGTNVATSYLTTLDDQPETGDYSETTSRLVSNTQPTFTYFPSFEEGVASGYGLPGWMQQDSGQQPAQSSRGKMTSNQLDGAFDPEKSTQYMVG